MSTRPPPLPVAARLPFAGSPVAPGLAEDEVREVTELADEEDLQEAAAEDRGLWRILYGLSSFGFSMMVHLAGMVLLAFLTIPPPIRPDQATMEAAFSPLMEDEPVEVELEKDFQLVTDSSLTLF